MKIYLVRSALKKAKDKFWETEKVFFRKENAEKYLENLPEYAKRADYKWTFSIIETKTGDEI